MTFAEAKKIATDIKAVKPDAVSGTVGEKVLWGKLALHLLDRCAQMTNYRDWDTAAWKEAAGLNGE